MSETATLGINLKHPDRLFIDGEWKVPTSSFVSRVICPSTEQHVIDVAAADNADIDRAVDAARRAFTSGPWPGMSANERADFMQAIYDAILRRAEDFAQAWTTQVGVPIDLTRFQMQVGGGAMHLPYYAEMIRNMPLAVRHQRQDGKLYEGQIPGQAIVVREPVGVCAAIIPWNSPLLLTTIKLAPAMAMGCTLVIKSSPETPVDAQILAEVIEEVGLPRGVVNIVSADRAASEYLVRHPGVDKIAFTGSSTVGKHIAGLCSERLKRCTLELGGKSAAIVLEDADLAEAVPVIVRGSTFLTGQACVGLTRALVPTRRKAEFVDALCAAYEAIKVGDPFQSGTELGPLAMARQLAKVEEFIELGKAAGAKIATGGKRPADFTTGFYFEPTVFQDVDNSMRIAREEIFGPVISVITYDTVEEAVAIANDSPFGLGGAVFTNDDELAYNVMRQVRTGNITQNGWEFDPAYPAGGFKESGMGREGGPEGLDAYCEYKTIYMPRPIRAL